MNFFSDDFFRDDDFFREIFENFRMPEELKRPLNREFCYDIIENDEMIFLAYLPFPGLKKEDINIGAHEKNLRLYVENFINAEFDLPRPVDFKKAKARLNKYTLEIRAPYKSTKVNVD